jgi:C4-dicarboxylate-specific signal transduction histidine kinase
MRIMTDTKADISLSKERRAEVEEYVRQIGFPLEPETMYESVLDSALRLTRADAGSLVLVDEETGLLNIPLTKGFSEETVRNLKIRVGEGVIGYVVQTEAPYRVPDTRKEPRFIAGDIDVLSEMAVPMWLGSRIIGALDVNTIRPNAFSEEDAQALLEFATLMAPRVQNARLFGETQQRAEALHALFDIGKNISQTLDLNRLLKRIVEHAVHIMEARIAALSLLDEDGKFLVTLAVAGAGNDYERKPPLSVNESRIGLVVQTKQPVIVEDVTVDPLYQFVDIAVRERLRSLLAVPLMFRDKVLGVLSIYKGHRHVFRREEITITTSLADQAAIAIRNARLYERMHNLEEQVRRLEKIGAAGEVAIGFAHEVRNPLTVVKLLLDSSIAFTDEDRNVIKTEVNRLAAIVEHYLGFAKADDSQWRQVDLHEVIRNSLRLVDPRLSRQDIEVVLELADEPIHIMGNSVQLEQVFVNLFLNAMDAMPSDGTLRVRTERLGGTVRVAVTDTGSGIPASVSARLFEPFNTSKENGVGLGLSIVRRIVVDHQGTIKADNLDPKGAQFTITLPVCDEHENLTSRQYEPTTV